MLLPRRHVLGLCTLGVLGVPVRGWGAGPRRVAVLYFDNAGNPELAMLRLGLAQMMISDLSGAQGIVVVERQRLNEVLAELELQTSAKVNPETAGQVGRILGAERLVLGSYFEFMGTLRVDARVVEVETGRVLHSGGVDGKKEEFLRLEDRLVAELMPHLGAEPKKATPAPEAAPTPADPGPVRGGGPGGTGASSPTSSTPEPATDPLAAALAFSKGLDLLDRKDIVHAREALEQALALDPGLDDARLELSRIRAAKG
jgi:TolB-like protein